MTVGALAATIASFAGWRLEEPAPTATESTAALRVGLPKGPITELGWHDDARDLSIPHPDAGNIPGQQEFQVGFGNDPAARAAVVDARHRLASAGWRAWPESPFAPGGEAFVAERGGLVMEWEFTSGSGRVVPRSYVEVWVWRVTPPRVVALTAAGWFLGGLLGWWLARRALRHARPGRRITPVRIACVLGVVFALSTGLVIFATVISLVEFPKLGGIRPIALWWSYFPFLRPLGVELG